MEYKKLMLILMVMIVLPSVSSEIQTLGTFQTNSEVELLQSGPNLVSCDIMNVKYPNSTQAVGSGSMTQNGNIFNYTFDKTDASGQYIVNGYCTDADANDIVWAYDFYISITGKQFNSSQGLGGLGIIGGAIALMFFFMILGFKFTETSKPLSLFFVAIALFMAIYSLQLGLTYSAGILEWQGLSDSQSTVYVSVLYLVGGISVISFILMSIAFVREFGKGRMMKNYGAGFDPITQTYQ